MSLSDLVRCEACVPPHPRHAHRDGGHCRRCGCIAFTGPARAEQMAVPVTMATDAKGPRDMSEQSVKIAPIHTCIIDTPLMDVPRPTRVPAGCYCAVCRRTVDVAHEHPVPPMLVVPPVEPCPRCTSAATTIRAVVSALRPGASTTPANDEAVIALVTAALAKARRDALEEAKAACEVVVREVWSRPDLKGDAIDSHVGVALRCSRRIDALLDAKPGKDGEG